MFLSRKMHFVPIRRRGFTLIELLVVVAVISVLLAILTPSLRQARRLTKRTVCAAHIGQIAKGATNYRIDNQNQYPKGCGTSPYYLRFHGKYYSAGIWARNGYLGDGHVLYCPFWDHLQYQYDGSHGWSNHPDNKPAIGWGYAYRYSISNENGGRRPPQCTDPASWAFLSDGFAHNAGGRGVQGAPGAMWHHQDGFNVARLDSSVYWYDDSEEEFMKVFPPKNPISTHEPFWKLFSDK